MNMKTTNQSRTRLVPLAGLALALGVGGLTSGCLAVAAGAGAGAAVAYRMGRLDSTVASNVTKASQATSDALTQLQLAKVSESHDALSAVFVARTSSDQKIEVKLSALGDATTKVEIRVGVFGDEPMSMKILEQIKAGV